MDQSDHPGITSKRAILSGLCPRCRRGAIFKASIVRGIPGMHERCPACDLRFEREPGYFLGAMYISYAIATPLLVAFVIAFALATDWSWTARVLVAIACFLPFTPVITLFSRIVWIYLDRAIDPGY